MNTSTQIGIVQHQGTTLEYTTPNDVTKWRVDSFHTKEPETIKWLSSICDSDVLFDVGANVGMYSIFAAKICGASVYAFEPESQNFSLLCKNIVLNNLQELISPLCSAISDSLSVSSLNLSRFDWDGGGSCHSFGEEVGFDLKPRKSPFKQLVLGLGLDQLIDQFNLPTPTHLKIDVDGFEHKVIAGASKLLKDRRLKSICIELNTNLREHLDVIDYLISNGFFYRSSQVKSSMRAEGSFKGCSEFIFNRELPVSLVVNNDLSSFDSANASILLSNADHRIHFEAFKFASQKLVDQDVETDPFPCLFVEDLFPQNYYDQMQELFPAIDQMQPLTDSGRITYGKERHVSLFNDSHFASLSPEQNAFWTEFNNFLSSSFFVSLLVTKFYPWISPRVGRDCMASCTVKSDSLLVRDLTNYSIGPHTDLPHRLLSLLYYMPADRSLINCGTSLYRPKQTGFTCKGGPHHSFDKFESLGRVPFLPNSLFLFCKTDTSFHGVEPLSNVSVERKLLINNIRM